MAIQIQMTLTLTEQEYTALRAEAAKNGKQPETLIHEFMWQGLQLSPSEQRPMTGRELAELQYREGKLSGLATLQPLTPEEKANRERLIQSLAGRPGKTASETVIEDRGPY